MGLKFTLAGEWVRSCPLLPNNMKTDSQLTIEQPYIFGLTNLASAVNKVRLTNLFLKSDVPFL